MVFLQSYLLLTSLPLVFLADLNSCGRTNIGIQSSNIDVGQVPHMCVVFVNGHYVAGGSLVARNQVVTLATGVNMFRNISQKLECEDLYEPEQEMTVKCGDIYLQNGVETSQIRKVTNIILHPDYNLRSLTNDLAVLVVDQPFEYTETVGRVCLPEPDDDLVDEGRRCVATGHSMRGQRGQIANQLSKLTINLMDSEECQTRLRQDFFEGIGIVNWNMDPSFICAYGEGGRDTCVGDGGGPLVCYTGDETDSLKLDLMSGVDVGVQLVQVGVTAWGIQCGLTGLPSVYSSLGGQNRCWLDQVISCYDQSTPALNRAQLEFVCSDWLNGDSAATATCGCEKKLATEYDLRRA